MWWIKMDLRKVRSGFSFHLACPGISFAVARRFSSRDLQPFHRQRGLVALACQSIRPSVPPVMSPVRVLLSLFSRVPATLYPTVSVRRLVGWLVGWSVGRSVGR